MSCGWFAETILNFKLLNTLIQHFNLIYKSPFCNLIWNFMPWKRTPWARQNFTMGYEKVHSGTNQNLFLMFVACRSVGERKPRSRSLVRRSSNKVCYLGFYLEGTFCAFQGSGLWTELGTLEWWISRSMLDPPFFLISRLT